MTIYERTQRESAHVFSRVADKSKVPSALSWAALGCVTASKGELNHVYQVNTTDLLSSIFGEPSTDHIALVCADKIISEDNTMFLIRVAHENSLRGAQVIVSTDEVYDYDHKGYGRVSGKIITRNKNVAYNNLVITLTTETNNTIKNINNELSFDIIDDPIIMENTSVPTSYQNVYQEDKYGNKTYSEQLCLKLSDLSNSIISLKKSGSNEYLKSTQIETNWYYNIGSTKKSAIVLKASSNIIENIPCDILFTIEQRVIRSYNSSSPNEMIVPVVLKTKNESIEENQPSNNNEPNNENQNNNQQNNNNDQINNDVPNNDNPNSGETPNNEQNNENQNQNSNELTEYDITSDFTNSTNGFFKNSTITYDNSSKHLTFTDNSKNINQTLSYEDVPEYLGSNYIDPDSLSYKKNPVCFYFSSDDIEEHYAEIKNYINTLNIDYTGPLKLYVNLFDDNGDAIVNESLTVVKATIGRCINTNTNWVYDEDNDSFIVEQELGFPTFTSKSDPTKTFTATPSGIFFKNEYTDAYGRYIIPAGVLGDSIDYPVELLISCSPPEGDVWFDVDATWWIYPINHVSTPPTEIDITEEFTNKQNGYFKDIRISLLSDHEDYIDISNTNGDSTGIECIPTFADHDELNNPTALPEKFIFKTNPKLIFVPGCVLGYWEREKIINQFGEKNVTRGNGFEEDYCIAPIKIWVNMFDNNGNVIKDQPWNIVKATLGYPQFTFINWLEDDGESLPFTISLNENTKLPTFTSKTDPSKSFTPSVNDVFVDLDYNEQLTLPPNIPDSYMLKSTIPPYVLGIDIDYPLELIFYYLNNDLYSCQWWLYPVENH